MAPNYRYGKGPIGRALEFYLTEPQNAQRLINDIDNFALPADCTKKNLQTQLDKFDFIARLLKFKTAIPAAPADLAGAYDHLVFDTFGGPGNVDTTVTKQASAERTVVYLKGMRQATDLLKQKSENGKLWPIEVFWSCGNLGPRLYVTWVKPDVGPGRVTLTLFSEVTQVPVDSEAAEFKDLDAAGMAKESGILVALLDDKVKAPTGKVLVAKERVGMPSTTTEAALKKAFEPPPG